MPCRTKCSRSAIMEWDENLLFHLHLNPFHKDFICYELGLRLIEEFYSGRTDGKEKTGDYAESHPEKDGGSGEENNTEAVDAEKLMALLQKPEMAALLKVLAQSV